MFLSAKLLKCTDLQANSAEQVSYLRLIFNHPRYRKSSIGISSNYLRCFTEIHQKTFMLRINLLSKTPASGNEHIPHCGQNLWKSAKNHDPINRSVQPIRPKKIQNEYLWKNIPHRKTTPAFGHPSKNGGEFASQDFGTVSQRISVRYLVGNKLTG